LPVYLTPPKLTFEFALFNSCKYWFKNHSTNIQFEYSFYFGGRVI